MSRQPILAANWKMNKNVEEVDPFFENFYSQIKDKNKKGKLVFAISSLFLKECVQKYKNYSWSFCSQNIHFEKSGAFTGEISPSQIKSIGIDWTLIGHSERRQYFNETDASVQKKIVSCFNENLHVIACVGETKDERLANKTQEVLKRQLFAILEGNANCKNLTIAYEPVWAIGTGISATPEQAEEAHQYIRELIHQKSGASCAEEIRILYGGSVTPENFASLIKLPNIDGALVGGASLKPDVFANLWNLL